MNVFYLGSHRPYWLWDSEMPPLFVSHRTLRKYKTLQPARCDWALDSGGFSELDQPPHRWVTTIGEYVEAVQRYASEIGRLQWAAPMDWMCEPWIVDKTGLSVREHQERTVTNYLDLRDQGPFIPVLQGWTLDDYHHCAGLYAEAGVDLYAHEVVGIGSVCRRQATDEIGRIVKSLAGDGLRLHGFGVKKDGIARYGRHLASADSMAWSFQGRRKRFNGCTHKARNCANCKPWALEWRRSVLAAVEAGDRMDDQMTFEEMAA